MSDPAADDHYSYRHYADAATASAFDERRFGGPIGELVAEAQARVLSDSLAHLSGRTILDVGTGTGRAALLLARGGARVTGVDASQEMLAVARRRAEKEGCAITFVVGDAHRLEFPDRAFDVAICLRVLMHARDWPRCIGELCRVSSRLVVLDYPSARSAAALESVARRTWARLGGRTEPYRVLTDRQVAEALGRSGFRVRSIHRQFVAPIAFHKAIGSRGFTARLEGVLDRIGLRSRLGSPVTLVAERV